MWPFRSHLQEQSRGQDFLDGGQKALGHTNQVFFNKWKPKSAYQNNQNPDSDVLLSKNSNILLISMMNKKSLAVQVQASLQRETLGKRNGVWHSPSKYGVCVGKNFSCWPHQVLTKGMWELFPRWKKTGRTMWLMGSHWANGITTTCFTSVGACQNSDLF